MKYYVNFFDPMTTAQGKYRDPHGIMRYSWDDTRVFRADHTGIHKGTEYYLVNSIEEARNLAQTFVNNRADAFGEDPEALRRYGFTDAEEQILDMGESGIMVRLADSWSVLVLPQQFAPWESDNESNIPAR